MIQLNCLYSETGLFDRVRFHPGINIILGKYPLGEDSANGMRSVNGVGKSTLVRLIDFALLSSIRQSSPLNPRRRSFLQDHSVTLEFTAGDTTYKIKRSFQKTGTVYFAKKDEEPVDYTVNELKPILGDMFFVPGMYPGGYCPSGWFRTLLRFFIKDDLERYRQADPIDFLGYSEKKAKLTAYNLYLMGLPNESAYAFATVHEQIAQKQQMAKDIERQIEADTEKPLSEIRTELAHIRQRIALLEASLEEYAFLETYQDVESRLEDFSRSISDHLRTYHSYRKTLERYQDSYRVEIDVDLNEIRSLYESVHRELSRFVSNTLEDVIQFRRQIAENRRRFLADRERELKEAIDTLLSKISDLERRRQKLYALLQEKGALDSIRHAYEQLIEERVNLERTNARITQLQAIEAEIADLKRRVSELITEIIDDMQKSEESINTLRLLYRDILSHAIFVDSATTGGYLDIRGRPDQRSPIRITARVPKSESLGKHQFSLLAYALTVFLNIVRSGRALPHFLIHDGVFHSIARKTVANTLNYVYRQTLENPDFQYIITGNEDDLYIPPVEQALYQYEFDFEKSIIARYEATPPKMIFKREF